MSEGELTEKQYGCHFEATIKAQKWRQEYKKRFWVKLWNSKMRVICNYVDKCMLLSFSKKKFCVLIWHGLFSEKLLPNQSEWVAIIDSFLESMNMIYIYVNI